jgi:tRNA splicing endonuclease
MADDDAPKSSYEIAMERLRKKDQDAGVEERSLSDEQRAAIADVRRVYEAKLAEREILHKSTLRKAEGAEPEALEALEAEYRRDRERLVSERDRKIDEARAE